MFLEFVQLLVTEISTSKLVLKSRHFSIIIVILCYMFIRITGVIGLGPTGVVIYTIYHCIFFSTDTAQSTPSWEAPYPNQPPPLPLIATKDHTRYPCNNWFIIKICQLSSLTFSPISVSSPPGNISKSGLRAHTSTTWLYLEQWTFPHLVICETANIPPPGYMWNSKHSTTWLYVKQQTFHHLVICETANIPPPGYMWNSKHSTTWLYVKQQTFHHLVICETANIPPPGYMWNSKHSTTWLYVKQQTFHHLVICETANIPPPGYMWNSKHSVTWLYLKQQTFHHLVIPKTINIPPPIYIWNNKHKIKSHTSTT